MSPSLILYVSLSYLTYQGFRWLLRRRSAPFAGIPGPPAQSWITGNLMQLFNAKGLPLHESLAEVYGGVVKVHGFFGDEQLYVSDPHALHLIILKDQDAFEETAVFTETNKVIFGPGLVATTGQQHRRQRKVVGPLFSSVNLRQITPIFFDIAEKLSIVLETEIKARQGENAGEGVLDMSEWVSRVALEMVGQAVLGYSFDPLDGPHSNPYTSAIKELIPTLFSLALVRQFAPFLVSLGPPWLRRKLVEWTPIKSVQKVKNMSDVMHNAAQDILRQKREESSLLGTDNAGIGESQLKDITSLLLRDNAKLEGEEQLDDNELTGQMTVMIFGAQDTTSSILSRLLHVLATHPDVQDRLRQEIQALWQDPIHHDPDHPLRLKFDSIASLPLLDAVLKETLRLHPPVPFVRRTCLKDTIIPYSKPRSTQSDEQGDMSSVLVPNGTTLFVGIAGSNRLESIWGPDAKQWKPERWLAGDAPQTGNVKLPGIYSGMMSFLGGGRSCVGYKFSIMEIKIVLVTLLSKMHFVPTDESIVWNLSQIISPSISRRVRTKSGDKVEESKGLPLSVILDDIAAGCP
ncbi:cytochrome P450 [Coprinopsis sp. MPI-PUGE-AT-0042]|nr:cytochrome P450 [Coprinopsis sp. MPI-PUGE-AT-0042]